MAQSRFDSALLGLHPIEATSIIALLVVVLVYYYWSTKTHRSSSSSNSSYTAKTQSKSKVPKTFRLVGIPLECDREDVVKLVSDAINLQEDIKVDIKSLAKNAHRDRKVATLQFSSTPAFLDDPLRDHWPLQCDTTSTYGGNINLELDKYFKGLTPLHCNDDDGFPVEYGHFKVCPILIAISGLGGHAFGSFRDKDGSHMWLRDSLPHHLSYVRIFVYGYDTTLPGSSSFQDITALATNFGSHVTAVREFADVGVQISGSRRNEQPSQRPLLLLGHSLGGLIIKKPVIQMGESSNPRDQAMLKSIYAILFFGVPSQGMAIESLRPMVGDQPNRGFLESLSNKASEPLRDQRIKFPQTFYFKDSHVICYYETLESPTAKEVNGTWKMTGPRTVLVDSSSATNSRPWESGDDYVQAINKNHSELVKFSPNDEIYDSIRTRLLILTRDAIPTIEKRFNSTKSPSELSQNDKECLKSLSFPEMQLRRSNISRSRGTCTWILKHSNYLEWLEKSTSILWIKGTPGAGKSTLLEFALTESEEVIHINNMFIFNFFFNGRGARLEKTITGMLRSLLHQILPICPGVREKIILKFNEKQKIRQQNWFEPELKRFFELALVEISKDHQVHIFIDALDEAGRDAAIAAVAFFDEVISAIPESTSALKICFSCRHYPVSSYKKHLEIHVEKENRQDIESYIAKSLNENQMPPYMAQRVQSLIAGRADGVFQWVNLVVAQVLNVFHQGKGLKALEEKILELPPTLASLYKELLNTIEEDEVAQCVKLFQWTCFSVRPLQLEEMRHAMAIDPNKSYATLKDLENSEDFAADGEQLEKRIRHLSRGLVEFTRTADDSTVQYPHFSKRRVQFVHQSVRDYLIDIGISELQQRRSESVAGEAHSQLSRSCLRYFAIEETYTMSYSEIEQNFHFIEYAVFSWMPHAIEVEKNCIDQSDLCLLFRWPSVTISNRWITCYKNIFRSLRDMNIISENLPRMGSNLLIIGSIYGLGSAVAGITRTDGWETHDTDNYYRRTSLSFAAEHGHTEVAKILISTRKVDIDAQDINGWTPLIWALKEKNFEVAKLLLSTEMVDVNLKDHFSRSPLFNAVEHGQIDLVKLILGTKQADIDSKEKMFGRTPLLVAAENGDTDVVGLLLATNEANINSSNRYGRTPLLAATENGHTNIVELLLATQQADVNWKDTRGRTPLFVAAQNGYMDIVELILAAQQADINSTDNYGQTPLFAAVESGHRHIAKLLVLTGEADVNSEDAFLQETPLSLALAKGYLDIAELIRSSGKIDKYSGDFRSRTAAEAADLHISSSEDEADEYLEIGRITK